MPNMWGEMSKLPTFTTHLILMFNSCRGMILVLYYFFFFFSSEVCERLGMNTTEASCMICISDGNLDGIILYLQLAQVTNYISLQ